jgi:hypothetical protein
MRLIPARPASRAIAVLTATSLTTGLLAGLAPAGQAAATHQPARTRSVHLVAGRPGRVAARAPGTSGVSTGTISGLMRTPAGTPLAGVCLTATGPAGVAAATSGSDGRYRLAGLRPGSYQVRLSECADLRDRPLIGASWPGLPAMVSVRAGRTAGLPPATAWRAPSLSSTRWQPAQATGPLVTKSTGSITGTVTGAGHRLGGICVAAISAKSDSTFATSTTKTGKYLLRHVRPGPYNVTFFVQGAEGDLLSRRQNCSNRGNWLQQWYPDVNNDFPTPKTSLVVVQAGRVVRGVSASMQIGGEISGIIRNTAGQALTGICVVAQSGDESVFGFGLVASSRHGRYAFPALFAGRYKLYFRAAGCGNKGNYAFTWWRNGTSFATATPIKIVRRRVVRGIDPVLAPGGRVIGTLRGGSAHGKPVAGACIRAYGRNGDTVGTRTTKTGGFFLKGLGTSRYDVEFDPGCPITKVSPYLFKEQEFKLTASHTRRVTAVLKIGARLTGVVRDSRGHPLAGACVEVEDDLFNSATTGPKGVYSVIGIEPGKFAVRFGGCGTAQSVTPQYYNDEPNGRSANRIRFRAGKIVSGINATLQPGGTLTGVVTDRAGHPLKNVCVGAVSIGGSDEIPAGFQAIAASNANGHYLMRNLPPGPYEVTFGCNSTRYGSQWFNLEPDSLAGSLLSIPAGLETSLNGTVGPAGAIKGTVTNGSGRPLGNICVQAVDPTTKDFVGAEEGPLTGGHGRYLISSLAPGRYLVQFSSCVGGNYATQWYRNGTNLATAKPVVVRSGQTTTGVDPALHVGGKIVGTVTGPGGKPALDICIQASDLPSDSFQFSGTDKTGHYVLSGLDSGHYSVSFAPCGPKPSNLGAASWPGLVPVTGTQTTKGINLALKAAGTISGRILGGINGKSPQGDACVVSVPENPDGSLLSAMSNASGRYVLPDVTPGKYRIYFGDVYCIGFNDEAPEATFAPQWFGGQSAEAAAKVITVSSNHTNAGINVTMHPFGTVAGTVHTVSNRPVAGECVTAVPTEPQADQLFNEPIPDVTAITTATGRYTLIGLPGQYKIEFSTGCGSADFATQWWNKASTAKTASLVTIAYGTTTGINATLHR